MNKICKICCYLLLMAMATVCIEYVGVKILLTRRFDSNIVMLKSLGYDLAYEFSPDIYLCVFYPLGAQCEAKLIPKSDQGVKLVKMVVDIRNTFIEQSVVWDDGIERGIIVPIERVDKIEVVLARIKVRPNQSVKSSP